MKIGVISDTHGLLRPEAFELLRGSDHILHAGDVGDEEILEALRTLAPVSAIRGNIDRKGACAALPATDAVELGGVLFYLLHSLADLDLTPSAAGVGVVVSGHSHHPQQRVKDGILYLNPGSAGPRRFKLPVTLAHVVVDATGVTASIVPVIE